MPRLYPYVGPSQIAARNTGQHGLLIATKADIIRWVRDTAQQPDRNGLVAATFMIDASEQLLLADRRSEHVACAGGDPVASAGEMFFAIKGDQVEVIEVSNQSTGFCPEPESWPVVAAALDHLGVPHPVRFTEEIVFRRCPGCGERNIVKEGWFVCGCCGSELPEAWNF